MNKSPAVANLFAALAKAQAEMKNPKFDSENPHFRSPFASLAAVRDAVIPVFAKHGLSFCQFPISDGGKVGCVNHLAHESGEWMEESFLLPCDKQTAHGYASTLTYAKRLSMQSVAGCVGDRDDDGNGGVDTEKTAPTSGLPNGLKQEFSTHIQNAKTSDELQAVWKKAIAACEQANDEHAYAALKSMVLQASKALKAAA